MVQPINLKDLIKWQYFNKINNLKDYFKMRLQMDMGVFEQYSSKLALIQNQ